MNPRIAQNINDFFKMEGKVAIVTGAGNGIGKATAKMMAGFGAIVIACDIEADSVDAAVAEIIADGWQARAFTCDITQLDQIRAVVDQTLADYGTIDILVNNGATLGGGKRVEEVDSPEFDRLISVNLKGVYNFIAAVLPTMRAKQSGKIVSVSSVAALAGDY
ncbi:MAG: SDR family NAD(P)-dependent oxidoreductase, partial [Bacillota bacterium]|nr:SDR family NAD(P)-dependent oxidoreductase [Bacillota bacterium]